MFSPFYVQEEIREVEQRSNLLIAAAKESSRVNLLIQESEDPIVQVSSHYGSCNINVTFFVLSVFLSLYLC